MKPPVSRLERPIVRGVLVLREYRILALILGLVALFFTGAFFARTQEAAVSYFIGGPILLVTGLFFVTQVFIQPDKAAYVSGSRIRDAADLRLAVHSHIGLVEWFLEAREGQYVNQLLIIRSSRLSKELKAKERGSALEIVLCAMDLYFADLEVNADKNGRKPALDRYVSEFEASFTQASTPEGAILSFLGGFYDAVDEKIAAEAEILIRHGSFLARIERHPHLVRIVSAIASVALIVIALVALLYYHTLVSVSP